MTALEDPELAALQAALVSALHQASTPQQVLVLLSAAPLSEASHRWIAGWDPRSIETAMALVRRWAELHQDLSGDLG
jgi:hypothetical protein